VSHLLLSWWAEHGRDLPWRRTRDPWAVLVSEVMLQQTQVERVVPAWAAFLERFPDAASCAAAPLADVLVAWGRLGYPRRAVRLHGAASAIVRHHGGRVPDSLSALLALPGVGPYTARAVLAHAFDHDVAVVDTNTGRVLARWAGERLTPRRAQAAADAAVPPGAAWAWSQAMLDLGATVCLPRVPRCERCPATSLCAWFATGCREPDPAVRTAGASSPQKPYAGSDRQLRGRVLGALRDGRAVPAGASELASWLEVDTPRAAAVLASLVADGLAAVEGAALSLPGR
jgi:A/G-specific adenine glycosylase